ncbi:SAM-dependent methyltransferase [Mycobacterium sp. pUA109]|uniref:SAM-dependent methyltransferase n=1 Tax=Mycobacterium sp. pUA109 TaxID=3238982 RepID=UPI00351AC378
MARTGGDTWDLASSVGATATWVAAGRALASKQPGPLIDDPYADALVKAVGLDFCNRIADGTLEPDGDPQLDQRLICERIAVRTRFFDDVFTAAGKAGIRQAVILASGLDTRAYRLDWAADTVVFEIDQPQVIEFKTDILASLGATPTAERRTVGIDLRGDWAQELRASGFDETRPTAWIAEGLLMYLPPEAQDQLLDTVTALSAPGSRVATDDIDAAAMTADWAKQLTERSRRAGSHIDATELFYSGERISARDHLAAHGWRVSVLSIAEAYATNGFAPPTGELAAAPGYLTATLDG